MTLNLTEYLTISVEIVKLSGLAPTNWWASCSVNDGLHCITELGLRFEELVAFRHIPQLVGILGE